MDGAKEDVYMGAKKQIYERFDVTEVNVDQVMSFKYYPYYIKADPKSNMVGLKFWDISWCFVKFGLSEGLPHLI